MDVNPNPGKADPAGGGVVAAKGLVPGDSAGEEEDPKKTLVPGVIEGAEVAEPHATFVPPYMSKGD